jgi:hypothetical protein
MYGPGSGGEPGPWDGGLYVGSHIRTDNRDRLNSFRDPESMSLFPSFQRVWLGDVGAIGHPLPWLGELITCVSLHETFA